MDENPETPTTREMIVTPDDRSGNILTGLKHVQSILTALAGEAREITPQMHHRPSVRNSLLELQEIAYALTDLAIEMSQHIDRMRTEEITTRIRIP